MAKQTARQLMEGMPEAFRPERARGVETTIQFRLSGEGGGDWYATIHDGACTVTEGLSEDAQATIMMSARDYEALTAGKLSQMRAFLSGRIKTSGDFSLLNRMQSWFRRP